MDKETREHLLAWMKKQELINRELLKLILELSRVVEVDTSAVREQLKELEFPVE